MNISFISEHYPPTEGGVATSTQRVARELSKQGLSVQVICFDHTRPIDSPEKVLEENDEDIKVYRISPFFLKQPLVNVPESIKAIFRRRAFEQMAEITAHSNADIVLSFYLFNAGFLAQFVARELNLPFIAGVRGNDIGKNIFDMNRFAVTQWVVSGADRIVCVNEHLQKRLLLAFPFAINKTSVIKNSVSYSSIDTPSELYRNKVEQATGWSTEELRIVFIGNLREKKGAVILMKALSLLRYKTAIRLLVIGPNLGPYEMRQCGEIWTELINDGYIHVTGSIPRIEVGCWAAGCDIVVMPSIDDGIANGLLEGIDLGLCPVVTPIFSSIVKHNETGLIVPLGNEIALADALLSLDKDRNKLKYYGIMAKSALQMWRPEHEAAAYIKLFKDVLTKIKE